MPTSVPHPLPTPDDDGLPGAVTPNEKKRGDGLERRPPAGIARKRETSADDVAPCQRKFRTLSQPLMAMACLAS